MGPITDGFLELAGRVLQSRLSEESAALIIKDATRDAANEGRRFFESVYMQMNDTLDEATVKELSQEFIKSWQDITQVQYEKYLDELERMRNSLPQGYRLKTSLSVGWEDAELVGHARCLS
jgi:hypothetical protein